jgi:hypothetical protein
MTAWASPPLELNPLVSTPLALNPFDLHPPQLQSSSSGTDLNGKFFATTDDEERDPKEERKPKLDDSPSASSPSHATHATHATYGQRNSLLKDKIRFMKS